MSFELSQQDIEEIIDARVNESKLGDTIQKYGGINGIAHKLNSDVERGLKIQSENDKDFKQRQHEYGTNVLPQPPPKWWISIFLEALSDTMLIVLMVVAVISIVLGVAFPKSEPERPFGWIEGFAIIVAVFIVSTVAATNDWRKDKQFRELSKSEKNANVQVYRNGILKEIKSNDIVVGDVIYLSTGAGIPADGLYIEGFDLKIDESTMTGEPIAQGKNTTTRSCLLSGCTVSEGTGKYLVLAVGENSQWGKTISKLQEESEDTPLQQKLDDLAVTIGRVGITFATATFCISCIGWIITKLIAHPEGNAFTLSDIRIPVGYLITAITIIVCAVPEGLPLAVTISLAYSVDKMMQENQLVRHLKACEVMGGATTICSDKTGTLTQNEMTVIQGYFGDQFYPEGNLPQKDGLNQHLIDTLLIGGSVNSTADLGSKIEEIQEYKGFLSNLFQKSEKKKKEVPTVIGNKTEGALLKLLKNNFGFDFNKIRKDYPIVQRISFSSKRKRMTTIVKVKEDYILHVKGAPEVLVKICTKILDVNGQIIDFSNEKKQEILDKIKYIAGLGQRTLGFAYKNLGDTKQEWTEDEESNLIFYCLLGIEDPLRPEVKDAVETIQKAGVKVRMVTGDNIETAKKIAQQCGIFTPEDVNVVCMEGPEFKEMYDKDPKKLRKLLPNLQVLARSSPDDKYILVSELKKCGDIVAVTGDGTNDAPALKKAHVGLAMGSGTAVAKQAADIIVLDDNFKTIVTACKWGRSIYQNIRKFLQFQLSVNVVALLLLVISSVTSFFIVSDTGSGVDLPLTAIQLLWLNLIMDSLAALALSTEGPDDELLTRPPYGKYEGLITSHMWVAIIGQTIYQLIVLFFIFIFGVQIGMSKPFYFQGQEIYTATQTNNTMVFNTFVWCQIWNQWNCRKIYKNQWNVCKGVYKSFLFLGIFFFIIIFQVFLVEIGRIPFFNLIIQTTGMDYIQWPVSIVISFMCIPYHFLVVKIIQLITPDLPKRQPSYNGESEEENEEEEKKK